MFFKYVLSTYLSECLEIEASVALKVKESELGKISSISLTPPSAGGPMYRPKICFKFTLSGS